MGPLSFAAIVKAITVRVLERGMTKWVWLAVCLHQSRSSFELVPLIMYYYAACRPVSPPGDMICRYSQEITQQSSSRWSCCPGIILDAVKNDLGWDLGAYKRRRTCSLLSTTDLSSSVDQLQGAGQALARTNHGSYS
jgi:hypothetical protein